MQENRRDIESAPKYTATEEDNATLNDEKLVEEQGQGTGEHKVKAVDVLRKAPGIDGDEALKALELEEGEVITIDEETNRRLLRKIDWHVMPLLCIIYGLQYLDKTTLSYASIMGLRTDTNISGGQYSWLGSMFYFGYLAAEYPANRLMQRLPLAKYTAINIIIWGATLTCMAATQNWAGLMVVRTLLGIFEASVTPGFALFTSQWYRKHEQGSRVGTWFSFNGFAQIVGGLVAYGIAKGTDAGQTSITGWRIMFLWTGLVTACFGVLLFLFMPDNPLKARWLTPRERILAIERIRINQQGVGNRHFKWYQFKEAMMDPVAWCYFFYALVADIPNGGVTNFFSLLIESFGYTEQESLLYGTPGGAVEVVTIIFFLYLGDHLRQRILCGFSSLAISELGIILIVALPQSNPKGRLAGYYLTQASATPFVVLLSLIATNVAGYTKKTTVSAMYLIGYCIGNLIGPQTFQAKDAPQYRPAEITIIVCWGVCLVLLITIRQINVHRNKVKERICTAPDYVHTADIEFMDMTDLENPEFRYVL